MQLQSTNSTTFKTKARFLDKNATFRLNDIAKKMESATKITKRDETFSTSYLVRVGLKNKQANFVYPYLSPLDKDAVQLSIGKSDLIINKNGQILECKKPFYKPFWNVMKNVKKYLTILHENFYNKDIIEKQRLTLVGFTQKSVKKFNQTKVISV